MNRVRYCRRGHELVLGKTAYAAAVWKWCTFTGCRWPYDDPVYERAHAADTSGNTRSNPDVGSATRTTNPGAWEHRRIEWRCRECNRLRVAAHRVKRKAAIGGTVTTNYGNTVSPITERGE